MRDSGMICLTAFISPYVAHRAAARSTCPEDAFLEVFCRCPLEECERRDTKGLYQKARAGLIPQFTGISAPYEEPLNPEIILDTDQFTPSECVQVVVQALEQRGILNAGRST
jgi:adenylylsulfate kinase